MDLSTVSDVSSNPQIAFYQDYLGNASQEVAGSFVSELEKWMGQMVAMNDQIAQQGNQDLQNQIAQSS